MAWEWSLKNYDIIKCFWAATTVFLNLTIIQFLQLIPFQVYVRKVSSKKNHVHDLYCFPMSFLNITFSVTISMYLHQIVIQR